MNRRSCSLPSTPCDVRATKMCCLLNYPECRCKCVPHQISCSVTWGDQCKAPQVISCDKNPAQRICRCVQGPQLQSLPPSATSSGPTGTGKAQGPVQRSCSSPSTPCNVTTSKVCCFMTYPQCQCKCVLHQMSCSDPWKALCKPPHFVQCENKAGQRMCRCALLTTG
ncbi:uncharacterized protein [Dermacentor andersoni]|uniref:uncharacterized protein isoform X2 n=1 Tax=Dermacentor andersoni TaxID=34620 RepID=UPI002416238A|nr:uncharacterized protein LOC126534914 isoform X2 [Dermacentor andersoni]